MNPDEPPPSVSSAAIVGDSQILGDQKNQQSVLNQMASDSYNQDADDVEPTSFSGNLKNQQSFVNQMATDSYNQDAEPMSFSGHIRPQVDSLGDFNSHGSYGQQAPSHGDVRQPVVSQPPGVSNNSTSGQPRAPSLNNVRGPQTSQTGPSSTVDSISDPDAVEEGTQPKFKLYRPNAFQMDDNEK